MSARIDEVRVYVRGTWDEKEAIAKATDVLRGTGLRFDSTDRPERSYKEWIVVFELRGGNDVGNQRA